MPLANCWVASDPLSAASWLQPASRANMAINMIFFSIFDLFPFPSHMEKILSNNELQARWLLTCPLCGVDLRSDLSEDLAHLDMACGGDPHRVYFSRVVGEQATFVVSAEGLLHDHGIHTDQYVEDLLHQSFK